ncbi:MAG: hypothetical protein HKN30_15870 [Sulfitobacter sp.]|nr:hypothetical protein [Sulfitobacter sp.]
MPNDTDTVAEIVTFRLTEGTPAAARTLEPMLRTSGQVLSRRLSCDAEGIWTDHITWRSMKEAKETAATLMQDPAAAPMMAMIAPEGVSMRHAAVQYRQE